MQNSWGLLELLERNQVAGTIIIDTLMVFAIVLVYLAVSMCAAMVAMLSIRTAMVMGGLTMKILQYSLQKLRSWLHSKSASVKSERK